MYNLFKLQKHDAFYKSREGGNCSIKCFYADCGMPCRRQLRRFHTLVHTRMDTHTHKVIPKASYAAR